MTRVQAVTQAIKLGGNIDITFEAKDETEALALASHFQDLYHGKFVTCYTQDFSYLEFDNEGGNLSIAIFFPPVNAHEAIY